MQGLIAALLFDLDDTLIQSQRHHAQAESHVLGKNGVRLSPEEITRRYAGISDRIQFRELVPHMETQTLVDEKWRKVYELVNQSPLEPMPGMLTLVHELAATECPMAIASASPRQWIERCLAIEFEIHDDATLTTTRMRSFGHYFGDRYVSARECARGKPHPDVYLKAREVAAAHVPLDRCFVVGDARSDVEAGLAAGMRVLYLSPDNATFDDLRRVVRFRDSEQLAAYVRRELLT